MPERKMQPIDKMTRLSTKKIFDLFGKKPSNLFEESVLTSAYNNYVKKYNDYLTEKQRIKRNAKQKQRLNVKKIYNVIFNVTITRNDWGKEGEPFVVTLNRLIESTDRNKKRIFQETSEEWLEEIHEQYYDGIHSISLDSSHLTTVSIISPSIPDKKHNIKDIIPLDDFGDQTWNNKNGNCITDYLKWKYTDTSGFINKNGKFWLSDHGFKVIQHMICDLHSVEIESEDKDFMPETHILQQVFNLKEQENKSSLNNDEYKQLNKYIETVKQIPQVNLLTDDKMTMEHLFLWAIIQNISHYALDTNEQLVTDLRYVRNQSKNAGRNVTPLVYQMKNNHFNPTTNPDLIMSISQWGNNQSVSSDNIEITQKKEADYEIKEVVNLVNELPAIIQEHDRDIQNKNIKVKETVRGCIEVSSIYIKEKKIKYFNLNTEELAYKTYCEKHDIEYKHQSLSTLGLNMIGDVQKSHMNPIVFKTFNTKGISHRVHHGQTPEFSLDLLADSQAFDINKHYSAVLLQLQEVGVIRFQDDFIPYDGSPISVGYYFVQTNDITLLHGSNTYSHRIVKLALQDGLIEKSNIKQMLKCSTEIPANRFNEFVNEAYNVYGKDLGKKIINRSVGCLNNTSNNSYTGVGLTNSTDELMSRIKMDSHPFVKDMVIDGKTYWLYGGKKSTMCPSNNRPLWQAIIDESNIILYQTAKSIGGTVIFRKTDCLVIHKAINVKPSENIGGYKIEEALPKKMVLVEKARHIKLDDIKEVNILPYHTSDSLNELISFTKDNKQGLLISGRGGTGKTYCALKFTETFNIKVRLAFTNKATININGSTIDSYLKLNKDGKICSHWATKLKAKFVMVDEISMLSSRYWSLLCDLKEMTGAIFILLGDYRQCQPIESDQSYHQETKHEFDYLSAINYLVDYNRVNFNVFNPNARYDRPLWDVSEKVFENDLSGTVDLEIDFNECDLINSTNICYLNTTRKSINTIVNEKLKPNNAIKLKCTDADGYGQDAYIYEGLKIILAKTIKVKKETLFSKNESSTLSKVSNTEITIGNKHTIKFKDFHKFCLLGYATTIHKSQGDTCDGIVNIFNWKHSCMNGNLRYTAITRATKLTNIKIINEFINTYNEPPGCVYMGVCSKTNKCYIGSARDFESRVKMHKSPKNDCTSRHLIDPVYHLVAKYPSISMKQLLKCEQRFIDSIDVDNIVNFKRASI